MIAWICVEPLQRDAAASHRSGRSDRRGSPKGTRSRSRSFVEEGAQAGVVVGAEALVLAERVAHGGERLVADPRAASPGSAGWARCWRRPSMSSETTISRVGMASSVRVRKAWRTMVGPRHLAEGAEVRQAGRRHSRTGRPPAARAPAARRRPRRPCRPRSGTRPDRARSSVSRSLQNAGEQEPGLLERPGLRIARDGEKGFRHGRRLVFGVRAVNQSSTWRVKLIARP